MVFLFLYRFPLHYCSFSVSVSGLGACFSKVQGAFQARKAILRMPYLH